jgi:hypothetical protein
VTGTKTGSPWYSYWSRTHSAIPNFKEICSLNTERKYMEGQTDTASTMQYIMHFVQRPHKINDKLELILPFINRYTWRLFRDILISRSHWTYVLRSLKILERKLHIIIIIIIIITTTIRYSFFWGKRNHAVLFIYNLVWVNFPCTL